METRPLDKSTITDVYNWGKCVGVEDPNEPTYHESVPGYKKLNAKAFEVHLSEEAKNRRYYPTWYEDIEGTSLQNHTDREGAYRTAQSMSWDRLLKEGKIEIGVPLNPELVDDDEEFRNLFLKLLRNTPTGDAMIADSGYSFNDTTGKWTIDKA